MFAISKAVLVLAAILLIVAGTFASDPVSAQDAHGPGITALQAKSLFWNRYFVKPDQGVEFGQITFSFDSGESINTDWGEVIAYPEKLKESTGRGFGYLNILTGQGWVVQNLRIQSDPSSDYPRKLRMLRDHSGRGSRGISEEDAVVPASAYFQLGSGDTNVQSSTEPDGLSELEAKVIFTGFSLPNDIAIRALTRLGSSSMFSVSNTTIDAEGALGDDPTIPVLEGVGPPPPPGLPSVDLGSTPFDPLNFWYALPNPVNVHAAKNQCVPMGHANSLQFLEETYGLSRDFIIPQPHEIGLGLVDPQPGDDPAGDGTLVGRLDTQMGREIESRAKGKGVGTSNAVEGYFAYLALFTDIDRLRITHAGGKSVYSHFGITSTRDEEKPTFDWICDRIREGADVVILYGRYKKGLFFEDGVYKTEDRTSGHMVRVFECGKIWGIPIIRELDDIKQNTANKGLRYEYWWVLDTDNDGMLNLSGTNSEIEFAMSTLVLPKTPEFGIGP